MGQGATPRIKNPVRGELDIGGRHLSYVDFGGQGRILLALHGHLSEGWSFADLARELSPEWRVVAPDQRGHGDSDRAPDYSCEGYVADIVALLDHLGPVVALGPSLGGRTAYQLAAWRPDLVRAFVVEDIGAVLEGPNLLSFCLDWPYEAPTREALVEGLGEAGPFFADRMRERPDGSWVLPFHPRDMVRSEEQNKGDRWDEWLASECPALLVRGKRTQVLDADQAYAMVERRRNSRLVELDTDHFVHDADPVGFFEAVSGFLRSLDPSDKAPSMPAIDSNSAPNGPILGLSGPDA